MIDNVDVIHDPAQGGVWLRLVTGLEWQDYFLSAALLPDLECKLRVIRMQAETAARQVHRELQDGTALSREVERCFRCAPTNMTQLELALSARVWDSPSIIAHAARGGFVTDEHWSKQLEAARLFRGRLNGRNLRSKYVEPV